jgi:hypothetical protein
MISATEGRNFAESRRDHSEETAVEHLTFYEQYRRIHFVPHKKHITSPLQSPAGKYFLEK